MPKRVLLLIASLFCAQSAFAFELFPPIRRYIESKQRPDLIERFQSVPQIDATRFHLLASGDVALELGRGFSGSVFDSRSQDEIVKLMPSTNAGVKEVNGVFLWAVAYKGAEKLFPTLVANDGSGLRRAKLPGLSLDKVLAQTPVTCNMRVIMEKVIRIQAKAEMLLFETGVSPDTLNPGNFIVYGLPENPEVDLIDPEIIKISREARAEYAKHGIRIPNMELPESAKVVEWPLVQDHIAFNNMWTFTFEQHLEFLMLKHGLDRNAALYRLATIPELPVNVPVNPRDYSKVYEARRAVLCQSALVDAAK